MVKLPFILDRSPSYRFYKKKFLLEEASPVTAIAVASSLPEAVVHLPDEPSEFENVLISILDSYVGNEKFIETATEGNISRFFWGHCSRICGILNSCPAANMAAFGLDASAAEWGIQDVLQRIPIPQAQKLQAYEIAAFMRELGGVRNSDGTISPPFFDEPTIQGSLAVNGCSKIEYEIFQPDSSMRNSVSKSLEKSSPVTGQIPIETASEHFTLLELRKYKAALQYGKKPLITKYETIIKKALESENDSSLSTTEEIPSQTKRRSKTKTSSPTSYMES